MPAKTQSYNFEALKGQAVMKQLKETVIEVQNNIGQRLFDQVAGYYIFNPSGTIPNLDQIILDSDMILLKGRMFALKRDTLPPVVTHNMQDDENDPILKQLRQVNLVNRPEGIKHYLIIDRVKIVFHPEFLDSNNPILGMHDEEFVRGCHLGVFPSYYEPWLIYF